MGVSSYHVCYHCKDRTPTCHVACEAYSAEKKERDAIREAEHNRRQCGVVSGARVWSHRSIRNRCHKK